MKEYINTIFQSQKQYFKTHETKDISFRIEQLHKLKTAIINHKQEILDAVFKDLRKNNREAERVEYDIVINEIDYIISNLAEWTKPEIITELNNKNDTIGRSIVYDPYGVVYIIGPFNYPFQLTLSPLVGAIASGNTVIIKPSENTPESARIIEKIISSTFEEKYIKVIQGAIEENTILLSLPFDYIFFTGSPNVGKIVMKAAANNLTPLTLELGGKSPTIVHSDADIKKTAERISFAKWLNCGQTCVAPDYIYAHESIKDELITELIQYIQNNYNGDTLGKIGKIINSNQVKRLASYIQHSSNKVVFGGKYNIDECTFEATILDNIQWDDLIMKEEIFGPLLPILIYSNLDEVITTINNYDKPLALYVFTESKDISEKIIAQTTSGDMEINSAVLHVGDHLLPFGGVGTSGLGKYHGKYSLDNFSHKKSVFNKP